MYFLRPSSALDDYGTARRASGLLLWPVVSSASQKRLARLGMVALPWEMAVPGRFFLVHPSQLHRSLLESSGGASSPTCGAHSLARRLLQLNPARQS
jgi:hypothetical protein